MSQTCLRTALISVVLSMVIGLTAALVYRNISTASRPSPNDSTGSSILPLLQAHRGRNDKAWPSFTQKGTMTYFPAFSAGPKRVFERDLTLSLDRSIVRYDKCTLDRKQTFLFDGQTLVRTTFDAGTEVEARVLEGVEGDSIKFQMATFGLLPILRRLSEPATQVVYVDATSKGSRFQVKTIGGVWYFYTNANLLIDRLEVNDINITYGDYRTVEGLKLPFYQQVKRGDKLLYEIKFETPDLNPVFDVAFFKRDLL